MRTFRDVAMMVGGAALFVYSLVTASSSPLAYMLGMAMLCLPIVMHGDRRPQRVETPAIPPRPDADVAQYLNDDDRKWLGRCAPDWTDPRPAQVVAAERERKIAEQATKLAQARSRENGTGFVQELDAARPEPTSRATAVCLCLYDPNGDREYRCRGCTAGFGPDRASRNAGWDIIEIRDALSGRVVRRESTGR